MKLSLLLIVIIAVVMVHGQGSRRRGQVFRNYYQWSRRNSTTTPPPLQTTTNSDAEEITEPTPSSNLSNKYGEIELIDSCNREPGCIWECAGRGRTSDGETPRSCSCVCKSVERPTTSRRWIHRIQPLRGQVV